MKFTWTLRKEKGSTGSSLNEVIFAPISMIKKPLKAFSSRPEAQLTEVEAQWVKKQTRLSKDSDQAFKSARITLNTGATFDLIFMPETMSTYELHTELRKTLQELFTSSLHDKATTCLSISTRHLQKKNQERILTALGALSEMSLWEPKKFGKAGEKQTEQNKKLNSEKIIELETSLEGSVWRAALESGQHMGETNNSVRSLADLPPNELHPAHYRELAENFAQSHGLKYEFWSISELTKRKAGAFLAVNRADPHSKAGIAILRYRPKKVSKNTSVLALVGKGLCFDTGGYNVKTGSYMLGMHGDMTGSALALSLCGYFAQIQAPFEVHAYLALAENLISPTAYKPNEVVVASDGTSIEVIDTDAEGRMVLADTLAFVRKTKPTLCLDYATLTGAAIRSLDTRRGAVFSNRQKLAELAVEAGTESGERTWSFPIGEDYREMLKSKVADLQQCASVNNADHIYAATFLSHFIGDETPWVHLDLVPAENKGGLGLAGTDTTGFGVFWTAKFIEKALKKTNPGKRK